MKCRTKSGKDFPLKVSKNFKCISSVLMIFLNCGLIFISVWCKSLTISRMVQHMFNAPANVILWYFSNESRCGWNWIILRKLCLNLFCCWWMVTLLSKCTLNTIITNHIYNNPYENDKISNHRRTGVSTFIQFRNENFWNSRRKSEYSSL